MSRRLNIIFAGTPDFAAQHLQALIASDHHIMAVLSQPDRPAGRGKKLQASAVKQLALEHNLPVLQPQTLRSEDSQAMLREFDADVMVVVAYGLILPKAVLDMPRYGCLNVHGSLLPKWRGAAPIQRSIWAGDSHTGVTVMQMDEGLDTGPALLKAELAIAPDETSATLYNRLAEIGPQALLDTLAQLDSLEAEVQNEAEATHAAKLSKQEAQLDWQLSAAQLERNVRSFNPWPMCFFPLEDKNIKVWQAEVVPGKPEQAPGTILRADNEGIVVNTVDQALSMTSLQIPGKKAMAVKDLLNARKDWFTPGQVIK